LIALCLPAGVAQDDALRANRAAALLVTHCGACHGPTSDQPRAIRRWADAADLAATVADPELVVPGDPDDSPVYYTIEDGSMPPEDSTAPRVAPEDLALLRAWIAEGAPLPTARVVDVSIREVGSGYSTDEAPPEASVATATATDGATAARPARRAFSARVLRFLGRLHPLVVHFPIGALLLAPLAEGLARLSGALQLRATAMFLLFAGALTAPLAAGLGWLLARESSASSHLELHRWLGVGTALATWVVTVAALRWPKARLALLVALAALVGATGHFGGSLTYGRDWLDF